MSSDESTNVTRALELLTRIASGEEGAYQEPLPADDDETIALLGGLNMLAEELDFERAKRLEAEALLADERDAYDSSPALMCSVDVASLTILKANRTLAEAIAVSPEDLLGRSVLSLLVESDRSGAERDLQRAITGATEVLGERSLMREKGSIRVAVGASLASDRTRLRIIWRDVSRERQLEGQLLQAQKMQAVGRLSGGIAHDFNNILAIILASASFVRSAVTAGSEQASDLDTIEQAAQRGADLTAQLLSFSRQQVVRPELVDVGRHLRELDRMLRRLISESVELSLFVAETGLQVRIDPAQLTQVVMNLVVNARDAIGERGRILVEAAAVDLDESYADAHLDVVPGPYVQVSVTDDGAGMSAEVLAQVFEPFFTTKAVGRGSGLGLSVCYGVVRQALGYIWVYSEVGKGTTVKAYLPLVGGTVKRATSSASLETTGNETILLVEDDASLRLLTTRLLERGGYRVVAVGNGEEALAYVEGSGGPVDLVVTDVVMPRMGGKELASAILSRKLARAVLYISGYTANSIVHNGELEEHVAFLAKPFTQAQLFAAVRSTLRDA